MSGPHGKDNCNKFVDILGLRTIFPLFMKTPKKNRRKVLSTEEHEEHVSSIIASMLRNCRGSQRQRLVSKFTENDHEKVDRLMELHFKYLEKVESLDNLIGTHNCLLYFLFRNFEETPKIRTILMVTGRLKSKFVT